MCPGTKSLHVSLDYGRQLYFTRDNNGIALTAFPEEEVYLSGEDTS